MDFKSGSQKIAAPAEKNMRGRPKTESLPKTKLQAIFRGRKVPLKLVLGCCGNSLSRVSEKFSGRRPFKRSEVQSLLCFMLSNPCFTEDSNDLKSEFLFVEDFVKLNSLYARRMS